MGNTEYPDSKRMKRRAISDIIAVLLLLAITVAGAVLVAAFFQGNNIFRPDATNTGAQTASLKITGYDTRDGELISGIATFDNTLDDTLTSGSEFIVINVENKGISKLVLQGVEINGIDHPWDDLTSGDLPPTYPVAGKFGMILISDTPPGGPFTLLSTNEIQRNGEVRLVIKLSADIDPDIQLNEPIRIKFNTNLLDTSETIITSGGVR